MLRNRLENQNLLEKLPQCYHNFVNLFSKEASDNLPPCRSYDHKIQLEREGKLGYGRLYNQSTEEVKAVKQYLIENLDKSWIVLSQAPFSSPVLFVKKPNGEELQFCLVAQTTENWMILLKKTAIHSPLSTKHLLD